MKNNHSTTNQSKNAGAGHWRKGLFAALCALAMALTTMPAYSAPGDPCSGGRRDCNNTCRSNSWINSRLGNGECNGALNCEAFNYDPGDCKNCYQDMDGDGYGTNTKVFCDGPNAATKKNDCNDNDPDRHPNAAEICDLKDNDCDGSKDEGFTKRTYYRDADGDGYGTSSTTRWECRAPSGYVDKSGDCKDWDAAVNPGAGEVCDNKDNNCNGQTDEGIVKPTYYRDADGDGYGNPGNSTTTCLPQPTGYVTNNTDCNDGNPDIHPGAAEVCDEVNNNCNTEIDEGFTKTVYYRDADGDGYGNPGITKETCMPQPAGYVTDNTDCNDNKADIHPGAADICENGVDEDCTGSDAPCGVGDGCDCEWDYQWNGSQWVQVWVCSGRYDCNHVCRQEWWITERVGNGPCNPELNCEAFNFDGGDCLIKDCYEDADGDGFGNPDGATMDAPCGAGFADNNQDCDDADKVTYSGAAEICDGKDNDCNGQIDDGLSQSTFYQDGDGDGYGNNAVSMEACGPLGNFVADNTDCDDANAEKHPGAYDICGNGLDEDCDGSDRPCGANADVCANLADFPLETQVESASPIVMLLMDDSGSMAWSVLCPAYNGYFNGYSQYYNVLPFWKSQWAGYNGIYYNPQLDYAPWPDTGTKNYEDADKDKPRVHPNQTTTKTLNDTFTTIDGVTVRWAHYYVWSTMENAPYLVNITGTGGSYSLDYYKVDSCSNGACTANFSKVVGYTADPSPPTDVATSRTAAEERQNFANWYQYYRTRQLTAISAIANVINSVKSMKIGLHTINKNNGINMIAPRPVDTNRGPILDDLYKVGASGGTPLRRGLQAVGAYYDNDASGPFDTAANGGECQQVYTIMMTDGYYNGGDPTVGNADGAVNPGQINGFDGVPFGDTYSNTLADVAMYYYERDLNSNLANLVPTSHKDSATHQHMVTYSVSFGLAGTYDPDEYPSCPGADAGSCPAWPYVDENSENSDSITDLWHAAVNGRGEYMGATNTQQLAYALLTLMQDVSKRQGSGASVAVNSHELKEGTKMYQGTYNSAGWTGDVKAYPINTDGSVNQTPSWSAATVLDARVDASGHGDRKIYTMGASGGVAFTAANIGALTADQQNALGADITARTNLVNYIRGDYTNDANHSGNLRSRMTRLGDIVHSEPKYVKGYLYVGSNDGMFHVFNAADGQEVFAYIPSFVYSNLVELANPDYTHRYFVDSSAFIGYYGPDTLVVSGLNKGGKGYFCLDVDLANPGSFTAADVKWEYPDAESSSMEWANMGFSYSEPVIIKTETAGEVLFFGNGYDSPNARAVLYALDPGTGNLFRMIDTGYGNPADNCNGLSTPVFVDSNNNGEADTAYAGDLRGNVWKFDISGAVTEWKVAYGSGASVTQTPLFQARDGAGNPQPITTRLAVRGHCVRGYAGYLVAFGTGKFNASGDFTDTSTQAVYCVWDWANEWEEEGGTGADKNLGAFNSPSAGKLSNLVSNTQLGSTGAMLTLLGQTQTGTASQGGEDWGFSSNNAVNWFNVKSFLAGGTYGDAADEGYHVGWTYALPNSGERVVADPVLFLDLLLIVSQKPAENMCLVGGTSYLTALSICSGARPDETFFDTNNDQEITDADTISGQPPSSIQLDDFITYSPTMIDRFIYFGPGESYVVRTDPSRILFWRFLNIN